MLRARLQESATANGCRGPPLENPSKGLVSASRPGGVARWRSPATAWFRLILVQIDSERIGLVQINVSARHGHLSPASQEKIVAKVSRLQRYFDRITSLNVTVDFANTALPAVEIVASAEHFHELVSHESSANLWRSVDGAVQKLEQQLRKRKEKVRDHKHVESTRRA